VPYLAVYRYVGRKLVDGDLAYLLTGVAKVRCQSAQHVARADFSLRPPWIYGLAIGRYQRLITNRSQSSQFVTLLTGDVTLSIESLGEQRQVIGLYKRSGD
jgi:hypothetical protein